MGVEIEGRLGNNDFRMRKLTQVLKDKDREIEALKEAVKEAFEKAEAEELKLKAKIEKLKSAIATLEGRLKYYRSMRTPKPEVETKEKSENVSDAMVPLYDRLQEVK